MAPIVASTEISKSPDEVFAYVTDPTRLHEWQESVIRSESSETPVRVATTAGDPAGWTSRDVVDG